MSAPRRFMLQHQELQRGNSNAETYHLIGEAMGEAMAALASLPEFKGNVIAVPAAPFLSEELGAIADKHGKVRQMRYHLDSKHKSHANADGKMTEEQKREHVKEFEAKLVSPTEVALWKRGASNAGYHYLGWPRERKPNRGNHEGDCDLRHGRTRGHSRAERTDRRPQRTMRAGRIPEK